MVHEAGGRDHRPSSDGPGRRPADRVGVGRLVERSRRRDRDPRESRLLRPQRDRYRRREARRVRHILCPTSDGPDAIRRLDAGTTWPPSPSLDRRRHRTGRRPRRRPSRRAERPARGRDLLGAVGTVFGPIRTEHGWHVARVEAVSAPRACRTRGAPGDRGRAPGRGTHRVFGAWLEDGVRRCRHRARVRAPGRSGPRVPEPQALTGGWR